MIPPALGQSIALDQPLRLRTQR